MKRVLSAALAVVFLQCALVQADDCCPTNECFDPCGGWNVGVDFLYWNVCKNNPNYAVTIETGVVDVLDNTYHYATYGWEPGFRVYAGKENVFCGWDLSASYTYMYASGHDRVENENTTFVVTTGIFQNNVAAATAKNTLNYQTFEVLLGYDYCFCQCQTIKPFFGIQGVRLEQNFDQLSEFFQAPTINKVIWNSDYKALGLELGSIYSYNLDCGLGLFTRASVSFVAGTSDDLVFEETSGGVSIFRRDIKSETSLCTPGMHLQLGLNYDHCWCERVFNFHIGYEFTNWWNVAQIREYAVPVFFASTSGNDGHLMMHGLFLGMDVGF